MDIGSGITFGNGVSVTKQPPIYLLGLISQSGTNYANPIAITVDSSGNIYNLVNDQYSSTLSIMLIKYDSNGTIQWQKTLTNGRILNGQDKGSIKTDSSDNVYICTVQRGSDGFDYMVTAKYDSSGNLQWQRQLFNMLGQNIAIDSSGNVYSLGWGIFTSGQQYSAMLAKYDSSGTLQWQKMISTSGNYADYSFGLGVDGSNNVYISGYSSGINIGYDAGFIMKLDSTGAIQWQRTLSQSGRSVYPATGLAVTSAGDVYITGSYGEAGTPTRLFLAKFDTSGTIQWQKYLANNASNPRTNSGSSVTVDSSGYVYVTGTEVQNSPEVNNSLICQYDSNGILQWQRRLGKTDSSTYVIGKWIQADDNGYIYVANQTGAVTNTATIFAKLPINGTKTGTYTVGGISFIYGTSVSGSTAGTATTTNAAGNLSSSTSTVAATTSTMTSATSTLNSSITLI